MQKVFPFLILGLTCVPAILAGNVYGTIREANQPQPNISVSLKCGSDNVRGGTDRDGVYRLFTKATGQCTISINYGGTLINASVYSYDRPTAYDFDIVRQGNGWVLQRR